MAKKKQSVKTVLITGCSSGIGKATVDLFLNQGWNVAATMRDPSQSPWQTGDKLICPALDVTDNDSIAQAVQETLTKFGSIDVLVNNAGYALMGAFETLSQEQIQRQFDTNVTGLMEVCRAVLPHFRLRKQGVIVNISSMVGRIPLPLYSVYNASKFAVEGFTEGLVYELAEFNVKVKIVEPGAVNTNFFGRSSDRENGTGERAYDKYSEDQFAVMDGIGVAGLDSEDVAKVIFKASTDSSRQIRYAAGIDAKAFLALRNVIPDSVFTSMIQTCLSPMAFNTVGKLLYRS